MYNHCAYSKIDSIYTGNMKIEIDNECLLCWKKLPEETGGLSLCNKCIKIFKVGESSVWNIYFNNMRSRSLLKQKIELRTKTIDDLLFEYELHFNYLTHLELENKDDLPLVAKTISEFIASPCGLVLLDVEEKIQMVYLRDYTLRHVRKQEKALGLSIKEFILLTAFKYEISKRSIKDSIVWNRWFRKKQYDEMQHKLRVSEERRTKMIFDWLGKQEIQITQ